MKYTKNKYRNQWRQGRRTTLALRSAKLNYRRKPKRFWMILVTPEKTKIVRRRV